MQPEQQERMREGQLDVLHQVEEAGSHDAAECGREARPDDDPRRQTGVPAAHDHDPQHEGHGQDRDGEAGRDEVPGAWHAETGLQELDEAGSHAFAPWKLREPPLPLGPAGVEVPGSDMRDAPC